MRLCLGVFAAFLTCIVPSQGDDTLTTTEPSEIEAISQELSACSVQCIAQSIPTSGCSISDIGCLCTNKDFTHAAAACSIANCTTVEGLKSERFRARLCGTPIRSQQSRLNGVAWGLYAFSLLTVLARFVARAPFSKGAGYGLDDCTIAVTQLIMTAITISAHLMVRSGLGRDVWMLKPAQITAMLHWFWIDEFVYTWCVGLTKMSIILFYLRVFPDTVSSGFRKLCYGILVFQCALILSYNFAVAFQCDPISYSWTRWNSENTGTCLDTMAIIYTGTSTNLVLDFVCFILPIPRLMKLQVSRRKKAAICLTFLVGLFVTFCAFVRLGYLIRWRATRNPSWSYSPIVLWSIIECNVGVVCACMPALAGPIKRAWQATVGRHLSSLYSSKSAPTLPTLESASSKRTGQSVVHSSPSENAKRADSKTNSLMRNAALNVSDEIELVDTGWSDRRDREMHACRSDW